MKFINYEKEYKNFGRCLCIETENVLLMASLEYGPRILYYGLKGEANILFEDINRDFSLNVEGYGVWYTYGGHRLWRSPEIVPETYYPDNAKISAVTDGEKIILAAEPTPFGTQYTIELSFNDDETLNVKNIISNVSDKPLKFAPWSITGLAPGGTEYIELNREDTGYLPNRTVVLWPYSKVRDNRFNLEDGRVTLKMDPSVPEAFKVGLNVVSGEARYVCGNQTYIKRFEKYNPEFSYPDFGCNFETYTNGSFIECEIVGDERDYAPGEKAVINEVWEIKKN